MPHDDSFAERGKSLNKRPAMDDRQETRIHNQAATNAKEIEKSEKIIQRAINQFRRWQKHSMSKADREILHKDLSRLRQDFWQMHYDKKAVNRSALRTYLEAKEIFGEFDAVAADHNAEIAMTIMQSARTKLEEALQDYEALINAAKIIECSDVKAILEVFQFGNWAIGQTWRCLATEDRNFYTEAYNKLYAFKDTAREHNQQLKERQRVIDKIQQNRGKENFLLCLLCSRIVWPQELVLNGLTLETFDRLLSCQDCCASLVFLTDAAEIGDRFVCPKCNEIAPKTVQNFPHLAWYCASCYASLAKNKDGKVIAERDWGSWFRSSDERVLPSDPKIRTWAALITKLFNQASESQKKSKREFLERQAEEMRIAEGESNPRVSKNEIRFFEDVLRNEAAIERNGWNWEHQKVLLDQYIADFYCEMPQKNADPLRFVLELDGPDHNEDPKLFTDQIRDVHLGDEEYVTLRIWNGRAGRPYHGDSVDLAELNALISIVEKWFQSNIRVVDVPLP